VPTPLPTVPTSDRTLLTLALALAAVSLGYAVQISNGNLHPEAVLWLTVALGLTVAGLMAPSLGQAEPLLEPWVATALALGAAFQLSELLTVSPAMYLHLTGLGFLPFTKGLAVMGVAAGAALAARGRFKKLVVFALLATHLALGTWLLHTSPSPVIDVDVFQRQAAATLLRGENPYAQTIPDIYGNSLFYNPGLVKDGRLQLGFPYPPLSLFLTLPGHLLGRDYRYGQLTAMLLAAGMMAFARPSRWGALAAAAFLLTPRIFFVLEEGWTEPFGVALFALTVFCACRTPRALPYALGLLLAVKQYFVLALPLSLLLLPTPWRLRDVGRLWGRAAAVALVVTLPLFLWNVPAFARCVLWAQLQQPFRHDALSYLAWWSRDGSPPLNPALSLVAWALSCGLALWRAPRTPTGFAASVALSFGAFFAFNKQAFCNYYFFVVGALFLAVAASKGFEGPAPGEADPPRRDALPSPPSSALDRDSRLAN